MNIPLDCLINPINRVSHEHIEKWFKCLAVLTWNSDFSDHIIMHNTTLW